MKKQPPQHKPMTVDDYAKTSKIPKFVFRFLCRKGYMNFVIQEGDYAYIKALEDLWSYKAFFIGALSRSYSIKRRWEIVQTADYFEKWKKWLMKRFLKHYYKYQNTPKCDQKKLILSSVISECEYTFKFKLSKAKRAEVKNIRAAAQMRVKRYKDTLSV